jgi:hypothetical protein
MTSVQPNKAQRRRRPHRQEPTPKHRDITINVAIYVTPAAVIAILLAISYGNRIAQLLTDVAGP